MLIKMLRRAIVDRNWREAGAVVDVPHDEAQSAIVNGIAEEVELSPLPEVGTIDNPPYGDPGEDD